MELKFLQKKNKNSSKVVWLAVQMEAVHQALTAATQVNSKDYAVKPVKCNKELFELLSNNSLCIAI